MPNIHKKNNHNFFDIISSLLGGNRILYMRNSSPNGDTNQDVNDSYSADGLIPGEDGPCVSRFELVPEVLVRVLSKTV